MCLKLLHLQVLVSSMARDRTSLLDAARESHDLVHRPTSFPTFPEQLVLQVQLPRFVEAALKGRPRPPELELPFLGPLLRELTC